MSAPFDLIVFISPKPGKADRVEELLKKCAELVEEKEPGTLRYQINRETKGDTPSIVVLETYKDMASMQAHGASDHYKELGSAIKQEDLLAEPIKVLFTKDVGGYTSKL